jgi:hypothetical protein
MDGGADDVELLLASAKQEVADLRADPRLKKPVGGSRGAGLHEHLMDLLAASEVRMKNVPDAEASGFAREAFARNLREAIILLREANHAIPWLTATRSPNVNLGSLYMSEEFTGLLVGAQADLVFVPGPGFMYSTISWPFSEVINGTPGYSPKAKRRPIIVNYPQSDSDRLLLHPLFAHEIAHSAVYEFDLWSRFATQVLATPSVVQQFDEEVELILVGQPGQSELKVRQQLRDAMRGWVTEVLCDLLAVEAGGPSFLWAAAAFGLPINRSEPSDTHPPMTLRIKLILDRLIEKGWEELVTKAAPKVKKALSEVSQDANAELLAPAGFLRKTILDNMDWLRKTASQRVGPGSLEPEVSDEAKEAAALLRLLILPVGGSQQPLTPRAILLGGWLEGLRRHGDGIRSVVKAQADPGLQSLVGKGIEMSTVAANWGKS